MKLKAVGLDETVYNLNTIGKNIVVQADAPMRKALRLLTRDAKINAPVDTGKLRSSIMPGVTSNSGGVVGVTGSNVAYAPFMELGTAAHWPPIAALEGWARRHGTNAYLVARAIARRGTKARRFLQKALQTNIHRINRIFDDYTRKVTRK